MAQGQCARHVHHAVAVAVTGALSRPLRQQVQRHHLIAQQQDARGFQTSEQLDAKSDAAPLADGGLHLPKLRAEQTQVLRP